MPVLWITGLHDESRLFVRDLTPNSAPPILGTNSEESGDPLNPSAQHDLLESEPSLCELEDDDFEFTEFEGGNSEQDRWYDEGDEGGFGGSDGFGDFTGESSEELTQREFQGQEKLGKLRIYRDELLLLSHAIDEQGSHACISVMPEPTPENTAELMRWAIECQAKRQEMEQKRAKTLAYFKRLHHLIQALGNTLEYEPTHPHIRETPDPTTAQTITMMNWVENWYRFENGRVMLPTWSPGRRGNMYR